ncbi:MAG: acetyl-CoA carboxylase biotin carboxylase subunit, partial [Proteobacteria bacterium]|nr:acetyl-CoA carboxylase biotin carboxylase subunit [Pseudomonadota bacterium]
PGRITLWRPPEGDGIRLDSHLQSGDDVPPFYDSMIGKLIVHGTDRAQALARMADALARFEVEGIKTNIPLQRFLIGHEDFARGAINIRWLEDVLLPAYQTRAV